MADMAANVGEKFSGRKILKLKITLFFRFFYLEPEKWIEEMSFIHESDAEASVSDARLHENDRSRLCTICDRAKRGTDHICCQ